MESRHSRYEQFVLHYKTLELDNQASWNVARGSYRRLVHQWHPDRFANRPREKVNAQQKFISVTKSYNELRQFFRENGRLPFESASAAAGGRSEPVSSKNNQSRAFDATSIEQEGAAIFGRDPDQRTDYDKPPFGWKKAVWIFAGSSVMVLTVVGFLFLDRRASQSIAEQGREVLKETPPSEFMPSSEEIRRSQTRGAFVKPTQ